MKKPIFLFLSSIILTSCSCQKAMTEINQKLDSKTAKEIVLVQLINDSRCPENVQCVWAGEVSFELAAYENGTVVAQKQFTLNPTNQEEITAWMTKHLPKSKTPLKSFAVLPYPKDGVSVKAEEYIFKLDY